MAENPYNIETDETQILQLIVDAVVKKLGYVGAMVATLEPDKSLPARAFAINFDSTLFDYLEDKLEFSPVGPRSVVYLDDPKYKDNLGVRAVQGKNGLPENYLVSESLYDLFRPIINQPLSNLAQRLIGIQQVIAVPFYLDGEVVGNLFAATRKPRFSEQDINILIAFGQQAAVGIRNARLYRVAEERRQIAQIFARMAFSAAASVRTLRNHLGTFRTFTSLVNMLPLLPPERLNRIVDTTEELKQMLDESVHLLDNMHTPWHQSVDELTDVNDCLGWAVVAVFPETRLKTRNAEIKAPVGIRIHLQRTEKLLQIMTTPDMLTEAFRVLINNGMEAFKNSDQTQPTLWVSSRQKDDSNMEIIVRDNGIGIKPEHLDKIFELGWSTKGGEGMGFGLFWTRDYIEGLGGYINVESVYKNGTTFSITLPLGSKQP